MKKRLLGLDIGDRYIGIAVSDPLGITAQPLMTYKRGTQEEDLAFFKEFFETHDIEKIICGLPVNFDGTESKQERKTVQFMNYLKNRLPLPEIVYFDERLTTMEADEILEMGGIHDWREKKKKVDQIAAQILLSDYMSELG